MSSHQRIVGQAWLFAPVRDFIAINDALQSGDTGLRFAVRSQQDVELDSEMLEQWDQDEIVRGCLYGRDDSSLGCLEANFPARLVELIRACSPQTLLVNVFRWVEPPIPEMCTFQQLAIKPDGRVHEVHERKSYGGWKVEDMYHNGINSEGYVPVPWSVEQAEEALQRMAHKADMSLGINWDTLAYYLTTTIESENSTTDPGSQTTDDYHAVLPHSRRIHRHDFRYLVGDAVFYDVTMTEGSDPTEQTFRVVPSDSGGWRVYFDLDGRELRCYWTVTDPSRVAWLDTNFTE